MYHNFSLIMIVIIFTFLPQQISMRPIKVLGLKPSNRLESPDIWMVCHHCRLNYHRADHATIDPTIKSLESLKYFPTNQRPQRRSLLMASPFNRLMFAYMAPRILKFQMSMIVSSLIGELSRKFIDPLLAQFESSDKSSTTLANPFAPVSSTTPLAQVLSAATPLGSASLPQGTDRKSMRTSATSLSSIAASPTLEQLRQLQQLLTLLSSSDAQVIDKLHLAQSNQTKSIMNHHQWLPINVKPSQNQRINNNRQTNRKKRFPQ